MSVDLTANMPVAFSIAALVTTTRDVLTELLGGCPVPALTVCLDRDGQPDPERVLTPAERETVILGAGLTGRDPFSPFDGPIYHLRVGDGGDGAQFKVDLYPAFPEDGLPERTVLNCVPQRTCVGVSLAAATTAAAAIRGGGQIEECQLSLFPVADPNVYPIIDPHTAIQALRLTDPGTDFVNQCVRFLRAIDVLNGWPQAADAAGFDRMVW